MEQDAEERPNQSLARRPDAIGHGVQSTIARVRVRFQLDGTGAEVDVLATVVKSRRLGFLASLP